MVSLHFDPESHILRTVFTEGVTLDDMRAYMDQLKEIKIIPPDLNAIHDLTQAVQQILPEQISEMFEITREGVSRFGKVRIASVHLKPNTTAISTIIRERMEYSNVEYRLFSTMEAAEAWIRSM